MLSEGSAAEGGEGLSGLSAPDAARVLSDAVSNAESDAGADDECLIEEAIASDATPAAAM